MKTDMDIFNTLYMHEKSQSPSHNEYGSCLQCLMGMTPGCAMMRITHGSTVYSSQDAVSSRMVHLKLGLVLEELAQFLGQHDVPSQLHLPRHERLQPAKQHSPVVICTHNKHVLKLFKSRYNNACTAS